METLLLKVDESDEGQAALDIAAQIIKDGGLVAFPTETVYGLGCDAMNSRSARKIYRAKGRPSDNPLIVHIAELYQLNEAAEEIPECVNALAENFWPGPLTIILKKSKSIPRHTTGGLSTVAVRMPADDVARELIIRSECLIAAPSANVSGRPSPTEAMHVYNDLEGRIDAIIDAGTSAVGLESTILDLTSDVPVILRPGVITREMLEQVIGRVDIDTSILKVDDKVKPKAPGMKYRHYAPNANLIIVEGDPSKVATYINSQVREGKESGSTVGIIASDENIKRYKADVIKSIGSAEDEREIAHNLYGILREFDETDVDKIYAESFNNEGIGLAIMNRLLKAAGHQVVNADKEAITRIIFAGKNGSSRSPMAAAILDNMELDKNYEILSRGILVQFPEPLNPKIEAVLSSNGIEMEDYHAVELKDEDINSTTIIFTMEESHRNRIIDKLSRANEDNTFVLSSYVGNELEIPDPYGGSLQLYGLCYESIKKTLEDLVNILDQKR
ncbi:MAG: threonylcarbamoyl-AMP synthase [Lachnospiraceae bacterium]|nr:threonylcarbamoyl-AMP synthase [Lachnospiraceae bacterium]